MKAAWYTRHGPAADVLEVGELAALDPGPGEVRVRLRTSGVNPSDWKARAGVRGEGMAFPRIVPHSDGAGVIEAVGDAAARRAGERVWIWNGQWRRPFGTAAEYITLPSRQAAPLPDDLSFEAGACLGIPAFTAWQAVRLARLEPGMDVLIMGGGGGVGHYAIQLARRAGARVLATASGPARAAHAARAGAQAVLPRGEGLLEAFRAAVPGGTVAALIDLDAAANAHLYPQLVQPHGSVVIFGSSAAEATIPALWLMRHSVTLRPFLVYDLPEADRAAGLAELGALLVGNELHHAVGEVVPMREIARAHDLGEAGDTVGNIVLAMEG